MVQFVYFENIEAQALVCQVLYVGAHRGSLISLYLPDGLCVVNSDPGGLLFFLRVNVTRQPNRRFSRVWTAAATTTIVPRRVDTAFIFYCFYRLNGPFRSLKGKNEGFCGPGQREVRPHPHGADV